MMLFRELNRAAPLWELRREMDNLVNRFTGDWGAGLFPQPRAFPAVNVWEDGECFYAEAEIPGASMKDLEILASGNELTIKGRRKPLEGKDLTYHRQERGCGEFTRLITLPAEVNADKVEAALRDGVLMITLPKAEEARARKIVVKTK
jgi:HSP20 family protein